MTPLSQAAPSAPAVNPFELRLALLRDEGFSVRPDGSKPTSGYMVSFDWFEVRLRDPSEALIRAYFQASEPYLTADPALYVGGWADKDPILGPVYYLDLSRNVMSKIEALSLAREYRQRSIYGIEKGETIYLPENVRTN